MSGALSCTAVWHTAQRASVRRSWLTGSGASRPSAWQVVHPSRHIRRRRRRIVTAKALVVLAVLVGALGDGQAPLAVAEAALLPTLYPVLYLRHGQLPGLVTYHAGHR